MSGDPCPKGGSHGWEFEEGSSGAPYRYCWKCGEIVDLDPDGPEVGGDTR